VSREAVGEVRNLDIKKSYLYNMEGEELET
jgi:hypothetical protein